MTDDRSELQRKADALSAHSTRDTNRAVAGVIAQIIPGVGSFLAELVSNIPREREQDQLAFLRTIADEQAA